MPLPSGLPMMEWMFKISLQELSGVAVGAFQECSFSQSQSRCVKRMRNGTVLVPFSFCKPESREMMYAIFAQSVENTKASNPLP